MRSGVAALTIAAAEIHMKLAHLQYPLRHCVAARRGAFLLARVCALAFAVPLARAQFQAPGISAELFRVFAEFKSFSAQGELRMRDSSGSETLLLPLHLGHEPGKLRLDFDLTQVTGGLLPDFARESMTQVGLNRAATVLDPEKQLIVMLFPLVRAYTEMAMPKEEAAAAQRKFTSARKELGRETIDGHDCAKTLVTFTDEAGQTSEATCWLAADFQGLPAQIETRDKAGTTQLRFKSIRRVTSGARRFNIPDGYKKYPSSTALVKAVVAQAVAEQEKDAAENPEKPENSGKPKKLEPSEKK